jgi:hypothetical protein
MGQEYSGDRCRCMIRNYLVLIYDWLANVQKQSILMSDWLMFQNYSVLISGWPLHSTSTYRLENTLIFSLIGSHMSRMNSRLSLIGWRILLLTLIGCCVFRNYTAAVMTQLTDVEGELNGFVTYDRRKIKVDLAQLAALNKKLLT